MQGPVPSDQFWGKLEPRHARPVQTWHPLADHCCDVAMVCEALLTRTLLGRRLARLAGREELDEVTLARLCVLAALHDLGKFNWGFQGKADRRGLTAGHVAEIRVALEDCGGFCRRLHAEGGFDAFDAWGRDDQAAFALLCAAISHHGAPASTAALYRPELWVRRGGTDPVAGIRHVVTCALTWFPAARQQAPDLPESAAFQHAFAGLVMLADWIGSDRRWFDFRKDDGPLDRAADARAGAHQVIAALHLDARPARQVLAAGPIAIERLDPKMRALPLQQVVGDTPLPGPGTVEILEAETGAGKTEAAVLRFLQLHCAGLVDGLYFALPTRTAATQLHDRLTRNFRSIYGDTPARPPVELAVPGYLRVDDATGTRLPGWTVRWDDEGRAGQEGERWAAEHPKRFLAAPIAVGTIDQVLLAALQVDHAHLRASALLRHLLVIDEVHASDVYMEVLLRHVLDWHLGAGGHVLLLSATLGSTLRNRLQARQGEQVPNIPVIKAMAVEYPVFWSGQQRRPIAAGPGVPDGKRVAMEVAPAMQDADRVAALAADAVRAGAKVLVLRNLVTDCVQTQTALEQLLGADSGLLLRIGEAQVAAPHHSRYAREDRELLDAAIEREFGKHSDRNRPCAAVATQTVQQSLDLDADLLITDLCPVDVLLQRIGRLHRHARGRPRPTGFQQPRVIVLVPADRALGRYLDRKGKARGPCGLGPVYPDLRQIEATWRLIEGASTWEIPRMNRELVERGTHEDVILDIERAGGACWAAHARWLCGTEAGAKGAAEQAKLLWTVPFDKFAYTRQPDEHLSTRLGAQDLLIELGPGVRGPFGVDVRRLQLPGWMVQGDVDAAAVVDLTVSGGILAFTYGSLQLQYDRFGLKVVGGTRPEDQGDG